MGERSRRVEWSEVMCASKARVHFAWTRTSRAREERLACVSERQRRLMRWKGVEWAGGGGVRWEVYLH